MDGERQKEREETYERIPWETLQFPRADRQWLVYLGAGALVVGALAYAFMANRGVPQPSTVDPATTAPPTEVAPAQQAPAVPLPAPAAEEQPLVLGEADLFAIDPELRREQASAHAEWFALEYFTVDGSDATRGSLAALMPQGLPMPVPADGTRVFVESVRAIASSEIDGLRFEVDVLVHWLLADGEGAYMRQQPLLASVIVEVGELGPMVMLPPIIEEATAPAQAVAALQEVPPEVESAAMAKSEATEVLGGVAEAGSWLVVVVAPGPDGVLRPVTVRVP